jgi:glycosyltransferase involved in cell wall biosynthesis
LKILFRQPCILPVKKYGGTERIIYWLMQAMAKAGHDVVFIGKAGTDLSAEGIEFLCDDDLEDWRELIPKDVDIVHLNYPPDPAKPVDKPVLYTLHGNAKAEDRYPESTVCITKKHAENHNADFFIYNPINFDEYPESFFREKTQLQNFLFLAKASWSVKNLKHALKVTKKLGKHLHIIGGKTLIPRTYASSHGFLGGDEKLKVMSQSDALIFPVRWHEPYGIAIVEAMALGLPVFGSCYGSLPELVVEGAGLTYTSHQEMIESLKEREWNFDSKWIREQAIERFNHTQQASLYLEAYERVLAGEKLNKGPVQRNMELNPEGILPF